MSYLGEFRRLSPALFEDIRASPEDADHRIAAIDEVLDMDRAWQRLAKLMDMAEFPLNPITGGDPFPGEYHRFGRDADSRALHQEQVAAIAAQLTETPFSVLAAHLRPLLDSEDWVRLADPMKPLLDVPAPGDGEPYRVDEEKERSIHHRLDKNYAELVGFFSEAAERGECTVFWAE